MHNRDAIPEGHQPRACPGCSFCITIEPEDTSIRTTGLENSDRVTAPPHRRIEVGPRWTNSQPFYDTLRENRDVLVLLILALAA